MNALLSMTPYMDLLKRLTLVNAFFLSQFSYYPLVWMYHSHTKNDTINRLHKTCLQFIYNDKQFPFQELLERDDCLNT